MKDKQRAKSAPEPPDPASCLENDPVRLLGLESRVREAVRESEISDFSAKEQRLFTVFFELAQEYSPRRDFLTYCQLLPEKFFGHECRLYLRTGVGIWKLARCKHIPRSMPPTEPPTTVAMLDGSLFLPIHGRHDTAEFLGFPLPDGILGWLELVNGSQLDAHTQNFYEKYARRIGFQLHNRLVRTKNREHLNFIQNLVEDIGHNVIVPNMIFKLFFNRLRGSIQALERVVTDAPPELPTDFMASLDFVQARLRTQYEEINRHYEQTSLFLETLLRRRHFEEGRYVLEKRLVNLRTQVVEPQVERYRPRLEDRRVDIDLSMGGIPDTAVLLMADLGLISQVYANLFSNAVKYAQTVHDPDGTPYKFMAYGLDIQPDAFGEGRHGVKLNVFTTGPIIPEAERPGLFEPGFRCSGTRSEHGTGHGLAFVKQVVDLHGGIAGYEPEALGNNFYIMLPLEQEDPEAS